MNRSQTIIRNEFGTSTSRDSIPETISSHGPTHSGVGNGGLRLSDRPLSPRQLILTPPPPERARSHAIADVVDDRLRRARSTFSNVKAHLLHLRVVARSRNGRNAGETVVGFPAPRLSCSRQACAHEINVDDFLHIDYHYALSFWYSRWYQARTLHQGKPFLTGPGGRFPERRVVVC